MVSVLFILVLVLDVLFYCFIFKNKNLWNIPISVVITYVVGLYYFGSMIEIWWVPITVFIIFCLIIIYSFKGNPERQFDGSIKLEGQTSFESRLQDSFTGGLMGGVLGFLIQCINFILI